jgi:HEAT repeat protein
LGVLYHLIQVHIVQRGAVRPLIQMLEAADPQLREMAAFALGRLAQVVEYNDVHPFLKLLKNSPLYASLL